MPLAALGGRAEVMDLLAPLGPVYQAGTLSGNPLSVAAGLATLRLATPEVYATVDAAAASSGERRSTRRSTDAGVTHSVAKAGSLFNPSFRATAPRNYAEAQAQESFRYAPFFHSMREQGVALPPSVFEAWFLTAAHGDEELGLIERALPAAAAAAAAAHA